MFDLEKQQFLVSCDVVFCESEYPYGSVSVSATDDVFGSWAAPTSDMSLLGLLDPITNLPTGPITSPTTQPIVGSTSNEDIVSSSSSRDTLSAPNSSSSPTARVSPIRDSPPPENSNSLPPDEQPVAPVEILGRGHRKKTDPVKLRQFITNTTLAKSNYPISDYVSCDRFS